VHFAFQYHVFETPQSWTPGGLRKIEGLEPTIPILFQFKCVISIIDEIFSVIILWNIASLLPISYRNYE
jgi:hypothetical protein